MRSTASHEQRAQRKVTSARSPAHTSSAPSPMSGGGPPPAQPPGGSPSSPPTIGWQPPSTHPSASGHGLSQPPQCSLSDLSSTQRLSQMMVPSRHVSLQAPAEQACSPVHSMPQPPQLSGSTVIGTHLPPHRSW